MRMLIDARRRWHSGHYAPTGEPVELPIPRSDHRVRVRPGTCDVILFYDIFAQEHYGRATVQNVRTIIDCGAKHRPGERVLSLAVPESRVIALEPDPVNYEICRQNLAQFGTASRCCGWAYGAVAGSSLLHPRTWARGLRPVAPAETGGEPNAIEGIDMASLLRRFEIETVGHPEDRHRGAELAVFTADDLGWIDRVRCFQVEPEDDACLAAVLKALEHARYQFTRYREMSLRSVNSKS